MFSGNGRHRRSSHTPALLVEAGVNGSAIAVPLPEATDAKAADGTMWDWSLEQPSLTVRQLTVRVKHGKGNRTLLNKVSFTVPSKALVAVVGPSGSGKSTLLRALTGLQRDVQGEVLYENRNLHERFAELRQHIGLVPQHDVLHPQLTVRSALRHAARLRFPRDTGPTERDRRVEEVLAELGLGLHTDQRISALSGGQRKRVSVALELLTKPSLMFLDEPTSGLDPGMDRDVMHLLRGLADDGRPWGSRCPPRRWRSWCRRS
ncbi:ATP-binding cassette domain-containing protein, partial [Streptomyces sp. NPDC002586]